MDYFEFKEIKKSDPRIAELFKLRYKVYVDEWGFERAEDHPLGIETDGFDLCAQHLAAIRRETDTIIGTARLIRCSAQGFPIEKNMQIDRLIPQEMRELTCEISRLAVSKDYRRRAGDNALYDGKIFTGSSPRLTEDERRSGENDIVLGLIRKMCECSGREGLIYWYVGMARGLNILLKRKGLHFEPVGPEVDYHGPRRPYFGRIDEIVKNNAELLNVYQQALAHRAGVELPTKVPVAV
ncbi:PEP-CTERM/exosortase system-associated acyltransferase [Geoalkalibacter halelectricus]|uniref:PEP-CTERM/exosortase system-associated acyltransferase n=1 Tax=Geoalkalibacter halelectricus TaxID=2847045 RepID=A0ABY5ZKQ6_9BACT|nr:PEP-CTERM/exosortase system-associated acyltransferase [Geoalkalibacter halelectricus]MDO3379692.1 PEP-CTERM/exosortase system-associated acyltransferase [Geoalkalibacter halelectricus]UWZ79638.1 PEP-CTERM/exosortase system-associated acyltransferase [Geoalkalibacter halelectricus]